MRLNPARKKMLTLAVNFFYLGIVIKAMRYWCFTSKPEHFKMQEALVPGETLDWPTFSHFKFAVGDLVFFYISSPVCQLVGKLEIEDASVPFSEVNPRNELRKWPQWRSKIPWMRLRVLQKAPVPFKPLGRASLYYHTQFKPSPYPKLLHDGEIDYVIRAFDQAQDYEQELAENPDGISPRALARIEDSLALEAVRPWLSSVGVVALNANVQKGRIELLLHNSEKSPNSEDAYQSSPQSIRLIFEGVIHAHWGYHKDDNLPSRLRLSITDTYLQVNLDNADIEILAETIRAERE